MKQLTCEMCGSTDLIKQDGVFVCQSCGCKYSVEDAKRMMIDGTVDVSGSTIKVDSSEDLKNLYELARRAKADNNSENAQKYYEQIILKDPSSWEANFYSVYYKAMSCKISEISSAATSVSNCINGTFVLIRDHLKSADDQKNAIKEIKDQSKLLSKMLFEAATSHMNSIDPAVKPKFRGQYLASTIAACGIPKYVCDSLCDVFTDDKDVMCTFGIQILKDRIAEGIAVDACNQYVEVIQKYDPDYQPPVNQTTEDIMKSINSNSADSGGCYIATAVYGSYDCPQVWTLRRFRDYTLAKTWYGRAFINIYYAISPTLVKWFGDTAWFKRLWRSKLDHMVVSLKSKGFYDSPYEDKAW